VSDFDPNDPLYYAMEILGTEPRVKQLRWVNDNSVNLEFYSAEDAALALTAFTHSDTNANSIAAQTPRPAKPYSKKPDSALIVREANVSDQKPKGAANRSNYYQRNPDVRDNKQREPRRKQPPKRDLLDYGDEDQGSRSRRRRRYACGNPGLYNANSKQPQWRHLNGRRFWGREAEEQLPTT
jgi:hypothetical protein